MLGSGRPLGRLLNFTAANRYLSIRVGVERRLTASSSHARIAGCRPLIYSGVIDRFFIAAYRSLCFRALSDAARIQLVYAQSPSGSRAKSCGSALGLFFLGSLQRMSSAGAKAAAKASAAGKAAAKAGAALPPEAASAEGGAAAAGGEDETVVRTNRATYWYVQACPLAEECSKASWAKTSGCASWESEEHCRQLVYDHLRRSSLHWHQTAEEHHKVAMEVQVFEGTWEYDEATQDLGKKRQHEGDEEMPPPRQKRYQADSGARGSGAGSSGSLAMVRRQPQAQARQPQEQARQLEAQAPVVVVQPHVSADDDMVLISRTTLKRLAESVERAAAAAQHAVKISTQAFRCRSKRVYFVYFALVVFLVVGLVVAVAPATPRVQ